MASTTTADPKFSSESLQKELGIANDATLKIKGSPAAKLVATSPSVSLTLDKSSCAHDVHRPFLIVGRQIAAADIRIDHKSVSRKHSVLYYDAQKVLHVVDCGTKKGTHVNGKAIPANRPTALHHDDTIQFGTTQPIFRVEWSAAAPSKPAKTPKLVSVEKSAESTTTAATTNEEPSETKDETTEPIPEAPVDTATLLEEAGAGLTGRAKRQAEIAAMMNSLDSTPVAMSNPDTEAHNPPPPQAVAETETSTKDEAPTLSDADQAVMQRYKLPLQSSIQMQCSSMMDATYSPTALHVTCTTMDPTGARFVMGGTDGCIRFFDFGGLSPTSPMPFATVRVEEEGNYRVVDVSYSKNGEKLLVATSNLQPKVMDRDGNELVRFSRGDVYVMDPTKTVGHTSSVTAVAWHPLKSNVVVTASTDGSIRLWDIENGKLQFQMLTCQQIVMIKSERGRKTPVTALATTTTGSSDQHATIVVGTACGSVQVWNLQQSPNRPQRAVYGIGSSGTSEGIPVSSLALYSSSADNTFLIASQAVSDQTNDTGIVQVWNGHKLSKSATPISKCDLNPPAAKKDEIKLVTSIHRVMSFSKRGSMLCVGTVADDGSPSLQILPTAASLPSPILGINIPKSTTSTISGIGSVFWHPKLNQILVATSTHMYLFYHTSFSKKGVLLRAVGKGTSSSSAGRSKKKRGEDSLQQLYESRAPAAGSSTMVREQDIVTPNALPMFQQNDAYNFAKRRKMKKDQEATEHLRNLPQPPAKGMKATGASGASTSTFTQFIMESTSGATSDKQRAAVAGQDPRQALFQYKEGKSYIGAAYEGNKEFVFAETTLEEDEDETKKQQQKK